MLWQIYQLLHVLLSTGTIITYENDDTYEEMKL